MAPRYTARSRYFLFLKDQPRRLCRYTRRSRYHLFFWDQLRPLDIRQGLGITRVADPVHFRPDPDPANQDFKLFADRLFVSFAALLLPQRFCQVFRIRICFLRIRILDFFSNPNQDSGSGSLLWIQATKQIFSKQKQNLGNKFCFQPKK